jgi:hypothetical protein
MCSIRNPVRVAALTSVLWYRQSLLKVSRRN